MGRLVDHSLVTRSVDGDRTRYRLLSTIRAVASDRLARGGKRAGVAAAHAAHYRAAAIELRRHGPIHLEVLEPVGVEIDHHRAALTWFLANDPAEGLAYAVDLDAAWSLRLDPREGLQVLETFLEAAPEAEGGLRGTALAILADMYRRQGRFADAANRAEAALQLDPHAGADRGVVSARLVLAQVLAMQGALSAAQDLFETNLEEAEAASNNTEIVMSRRGLVSLALESGDAAGARVLLDAALADAERLGSPWMIGPLLGDKARLALLEGQFDQARALAEDVLVMAQRYGSANAVAECSRDLARILRHQGETDHAIELLGESGRIFEAEGDAGGIAHVLTELGLVYGLRGDLARAVLLLGGAAGARARPGLATPGSESADIERTTTAARKGLGEETFRHEWATGERATTSSLLSGAGEPRSAPG